MDQEKVGNKIKDIRKSNNLTQKELADELGVTYQAVSKWENGKNLPDIAVLKDICAKYNVDINELLDNKIEPKEKVKNKKITYIIVGIVVILIAIIGIIIYVVHSNSDFNFSTIDTTCEEFKLSGSIAYNNNKTYIYISNMDYCGTNGDIEYKKIVAELHVSKDDIDQNLYTDEQENLTLKDYIDNFSMNVNSNVCLTHKGDFSLTISAYDKDGKITNYTIPLELSATCN